MRDDVLAELATAGAVRDALLTDVQRAGRMLNAARCPGLSGGRPLTHRRTLMPEPPSDWQRERAAAMSFHDAEVLAVRLDREDPALELVV